MVGAARRNGTLYKDIVRISGDYLGPAAERFVNRQVQTHLGKEPEKLHVSDLAELINWIMLAFALLTNDTDIIHEYSGRLTELTNKNRPIGKSRATP